MPDAPPETLMQLSVAITVHYDPRLGAPPSVELRVGGASSGAHAALPVGQAPSRPERAPPPVAWVAPPSHVAQFYPSAPDEGQHAHNKRELALVLWRVLAGPGVPLARAWFDLDGAAVVPQPPLFPLHTDVAAACRRLGTRRLGRAALGFGSEGAPPRMAASRLPVGGAFARFGAPELPDTECDVDDLVRRMVAEHVSAVELAVQRALAHREERARVEGAGALPSAETVEQELRAYYALAEAICTDAWERPELVGCPPLAPLRLEYDPGAPPSPRRTPSTGAPLPATPPATE